MGDPYWRYGAPADRVSVPRSSFPGQLSSEPTTLPTHAPWSSNDLHSNPIDYAQKDTLPLRPGSYGVNYGNGLHDDSTLISGLSAEASYRGYQNPIGENVPDLINERPASLPKVDSASRESNVLFVDGLPTDCLRREVGHLFRPFIGFKDIRVVHKEPRRYRSLKCAYFIASSGDKAMVLCFVEFDDAKCALTAMEALEGYKFDDKKPDSPVLRIQFAHFPFQLPTP